jgi:putative transposase
MVPQNRWIRLPAGRLSIQYDFALGPRRARMSAASRQLKGRLFLFSRMRSATYGLGASPDVGYPLGCVDSKDPLFDRSLMQGCLWEAASGVMDRLVLGDAAWERMAPLIIGRTDQKGSTGRDNRMFLEACYGSCVRALGAIFRRCSAIGTAPSAASVDGAARASGSASSRRCPMIRPSNI